MAALVKALSDSFPPGQLIFFRCFFGLPPLLVWMAWRGEVRSGMRTTRPLGHLWRAMIGTAAMSVYFIALGLLPLPDVTAILYASPLMTLVLASLMLGERVGCYRWGAVGIGFAGVLLILWPHVSTGRSIDDTSVTGAICAFATAACMALVMIQLRSLTRTERTSTVVFYFTIFSSLLALLSAPFGWEFPTAKQMALLVCLGFAGGIGQILLTQSYRYAPASVVAPFEYSSMLMALLLGYAVFGDVPEAIVLVGAGIVIAAGLYVIHRERRLGIADARQTRTIPGS